jgi:hypothetical protein
MTVIGAGPVGLVRGPLCRVPRHARGIGTFGPRPLPAGTALLGRGLDYFATAPTNTPGSTCSWSAAATARSTGR